MTLALTIGVTLLASLAASATASAAGAAAPESRPSFDDIVADVSKRGLTQNCEPCGGFNQPAAGKNDGSLKFRIVGGKKSVEPRPWMAYMQILSKYRCAGALINRRWILTAAHCVCSHGFCEKDASGNMKATAEVKGKIAIFLGIKNLTEAKKGNSNPNEYSSLSAVVHPKYDNELYDLTLIETNEEVNFTAKIQPICLPFGQHFPDIRQE